LTGPEDLRARFTGHTVAALVAELASLRPRPGSTVGYATRIALRELGRRAVFPGGQLERLDELIVPLVTARAPGLLAL
jgi:uroporphyrinogen-III synthase